MKALNIFAPFLLAACATDWGVSQSIVEYDCGDVVLLGRVTKTHYRDDIPAKEECTNAKKYECIEWKGRYDLEITVQRVLIGNESRSVVRAFYIGHGQIRDDVDFVFVLSPTKDGYQLEKTYPPEKRSKIELPNSCLSA